MHLGPQRVDERVADQTEAGRLFSAPGENHLGARARSRVPDGAGAITNAAANDAAAAAKPAKRFAGCDVLPDLSGFTDVVSEPP